MEERTMQLYVFTRLGFTFPCSCLTISEKDGKVKNLLLAAHALNGHIFPSGAVYVAAQVCGGVNKLLLVRP